MTNSIFLIIFKSTILQLISLSIILFLLFIIFEIIPLFFGIKNTIKSNLTDFIKYQVIRGIYTISLGIFFIVLFFYIKINFGLINITNFSTFSQVIILYFCSEFIIYIAHLLAHKYKIPILSKAHSFHHTLTTNMEWVNSRKEHYFVLTLFTFIFCLFFFVIFKSSNISHSIVIALYFLLNAFSHYRIPMSIPVLDQILLFPKDHLRHHTERSGPYGVTLSLFDSIFNTRR